MPLLTQADHSICIPLRVFHTTVDNGRLHHLPCIALVSHDQHHLKGRGHSTASTNNTWQSTSPVLLALAIASTAHNNDLLPHSILPTLPSVAVPIEWPGHCHRADAPAQVCA